MTTRQILVVLVVAGLAMTMVAGCGGKSKVTKENYDKIKVGMTVDEVQDVLGKPTQESTLGIGPLTMHNMSWTDGDKVITVSFKDGKVFSIASAKGL